MFNHHLIKRLLVSGLAIAAAGFPAAAQARLNLEPPAVSSATSHTLPSTFHTDASSSGYRSAQANGSSVSVPQASSGFQWDDAGIGAAGAVVLLGGGALGIGVMRRRRRPVVS